jgi:phosphoribosylglycinamide formyltransferase-1
MTATARVAVFASGYGANLETCLRLASRRPDLLSIATVVSDKPGCRATQIAHGAGIPCIARSFDQLVGRASDCTDDAAREAYRHRARAFHEYICRELVAAEETGGEFSAVVFSYRRWVHGNLLDRYRGRIVNQHPGDLTLLDQLDRRRLTGNDPVLKALTMRCKTVRTTSFLVDDGHDTGSIVAQGPALTTNGLTPTRQDADRLEFAQKAISDPPSLICALLLLLMLSLTYGPGRYPDGSRQLVADGRALPFGGVDAGLLRDGDPQFLSQPAAGLLMEQMDLDARDLNQRGQATCVNGGQRQ